MLVTYFKPKVQNLVVKNQYGTDSSSQLELESKF
jgi:hypothetical protein